jgi:hypothetical protein
MFLKHIGFPNSCVPDWSASMWQCRYPGRQLIEATGQERTATLECVKLFGQNS